MESTTALVAIGISLLIGAISPGPSFVLVARLAMANSRADGIAAAAGMGIGGVIFSILALTGLQAVLTTVPIVYSALKIAGGLYLAYLAYRIWSGAKEPLTINQTNSDSGFSAKRSFSLGLTTQVSNPKTAVVYGSIFAALLPANHQAAVHYIIPLLVFVVEFGWYTLVSLVLSAKANRVAYLKFKALIDRLTGGVMAALGIKLTSSAFDHS